MATSIEQILGRDINSLKELREEIKRLQDSIANIDPTTQQFKDTAEKLAAAQEQLTSVTRAGKDGMDVAKDSIIGMEREYRNLYNTYKTLSEEQRNSDFGRSMAEQLNTLSTKLNETKKDVGNFKDNIGRYAESAIEAFSKMGGSVGGLVGPFANATKGIMGFNTALKANPVGAVITLIMGLVNVLKSLTGSIKGNEESQMRLNQAMASFQPIIDAASNAMDRMGQAIVRVIEFIARVVDKIRLAKAAFTDFIGVTKGAKKQMEEQQKTYKELAASVNNLTNTKREYQELNAADQAEVETLREQASATSNATEKRELLLQAKEKQEAINARNIEVAKEELRILEEQAKLTANDAAMKDKLAAAVAKVSQVEADAARKMRELNGQLNGGSTSLGGLSTATKNYREEAKKLYEELVEESKDEVQKIQEKYQKEKKLLEKYHLDTTLLTKKYQKDLAKAQEDAWREALNNRLAQRKADIEYQEQTVEIAKVSSYREAENVINAISQIRRHLQLAKEEGAKSPEEWHRIFTEIIETANQDFGTALKLPPEFDKKNWRGFEMEFKNQMESLMAIAKEKSKELYKVFWEDTIFSKNDADNVRDRMEAEANTMIDALLNGVSESDYRVLQQEQMWDALADEKQFLEESILNWEGTQQGKIELMQRYYEVLGQMSEAHWQLEALNAERTANIFNDALDLQSQVGPALNSIGSMIEANIEAKKKDGKITEEEANKQKKSLVGLQNVIMAVNLASVAANTAAGIMAVWKAYALEKVANAETAAATGPAAAATLAVLNAKSLASAILQTASLATQGIAQMASIRAGNISKVSSLKGENSGGGAEGTAATPQEIDSTPYTYTRTLQTAEEEDQLNRPIWVSVQDIESSLNHSVQVREETSF